MATSNKRTPEREQAICRALESGASRRAACAAARIDVKTLARWIATSAEFSQAVARAEAAVEVVMTSAILKAARPRTITKTRTKRVPRDDGSILEIVETTTEETVDWRAAAFWLTTRRPNEWGRNHLNDFEDKTDAEIMEMLRGAPELKGEAGERAA